jgi:hypothetical protein
MSDDGAGRMSRYFYPCGSFYNLHEQNICLSNFGNLVFAISFACNSRKQEILLDNHRRKNGQETQKTAFLAD